jgi:hypothetical protein
LDAVKASWSSTDLGSNSGGIEDYFTVAPKYAGVDYNNLTAVVAAASNGNTQSFNLEIQHDNEPELNELYENLTIPQGTGPTVAESDYLKVVIEQSQLVDITYLDCSAYTNVRPVSGTFAAIGGSDGTTPVAADYTGDSAGPTGFYAFDLVDDFEVVAALDFDDDTILNVGATYAENRGDCLFFGHLPNSNTSVSALTTDRDSLTVDSPYAAIFAGGLRIPDPWLDNTEASISELGDVIGAAMRSAVEYGEWWSFAGPRRGLIYNAYGVVNNFGTKGTANLDLLAQRGINMVVERDSKIMVWGNFTGQLATSKKSYLNVSRLHVHIKKSLRPLLEMYIEEPNDFPTFRQIYNDVQPYLDSLLGEKRALADYSWQGDQFANTDGDLQVNLRTDLNQGKYKVELYLVEIVSLQEFTISIISTPSGVSFEDNLN